MTIVAETQATHRRPAFLPLRFALRELRGGLRGFYVFIACIALGVMTISGVASVAASLSDGLAREGLQEARRAVGALRGDAPAAAPAGTAIRALIEQYEYPIEFLLSGDETRLEGQVGDAVLRVILGIAFTIFVSAGTYALIERPSRRFFRDRLMAKKA